MNFPHWVLRPLNKLLHLGLKKTKQHSSSTTRKVADNDQISQEGRREKTDGRGKKGEKAWEERKVREGHKERKVKG